MDRLVSVAVPVPLLPALTYRVPVTHIAPPPGARVRVPLGSRVVTGCVVGVDVNPDTDSVEVKDLIECVDTDAFLPRSVMEIALWVAEYYAAGPGDALAAAMPPFAWIHGTKGTQQATAFKTVRMAFITTAGRGRHPG